MMRAFFKPPRQSRYAKGERLSATGEKAVPEPRCEPVARKSDHDPISEGSP
jgi:hypothetical protein